jgi:hypothetical protein
MSGEFGENTYPFKCGWSKRSGNIDNEIIYYINKRCQTTRKIVSRFREEIF